jgi:hypothetical protein
MVHLDANRLYHAFVLWHSMTKVRSLVVLIRGCRLTGYLVDIGCSFLRSKYKAEVLACMAQRHAESFAGEKSARKK